MRTNASTTFNTNGPEYSISDQHWYRIKLVLGEQGKVRA